MSRPVIVIGAGPSGLAAALELRRRGAADVLVLEREADPGGIPRHARHQGFGLRDLRRPLSGPAYARRYAELATAAGAELRTETMVTGWSPGGPLELTGPLGRERVEPAAVVLATGCRERPRSARLVPGSRPAGVITTGTLQQLVYLKGLSPGTRALVVGAEHVSFSALLTLVHGGARAVGMVTELPRHQSLALFRAGAALRFRAPVWTRTAVSAIHGRPRVEEVELTDLDSGATRRVACDTVVFTADWIPDHELAVMAGLAMDAGTRGPAVDAALRTSRPGVFAAGNLLHGAETADVAALGGRHAGALAAAFLSDGHEWPEARVPIECEPPLHWIAPNVVVPNAGAPPRGRFALRSSEFASRPRIEIEQGGRTLWAGRVARLVPGRSARLPHAWTDSVDPSAEPVRVRLAARG
ncbi:MAG TPA: NAD(P)/FAD-dependent oxidoreductase [Thermoleophilaceae bacterium]|nr:NAD(P)/FAD-dependent oxidoreductase [Thermoleophilaceae bacterium]